jgi:tellurite resistance protein TerC
MHSIGTWWLWLSFFAFVLTVLSIDTFLLKGRKAHHVSTREALGWTVVWVMCALVFNFFLWFYLSQTQDAIIAKQKAMEFFTGYFIEESLSVDNLFIFIMIFNYFCVPKEYQRRVLLYGILGAIILRFIVISLGIWLVSKIHWILYLFGAFLVITGVKMLFFANNETDLANNALLKWMRRHVRFTDTFHREKFFVIQQGLWYATPLFLVLVLIEASDVVFALDSIPAIFAVTQDSFIAFTSNIFAILGLRSLYFLLAGMAERFSLLKFGIAIMLAFIGIKMLIAPWIKIPIGIALSIVVAILATSTVLSLLITDRRKKHD